LDRHPAPTSCADILHRFSAPIFCTDFQDRHPGSTEMEATKTVDVEDVARGLNLNGVLRATSGIRSRMQGLCDLELDDPAIKAIEIIPAGDPKDAKAIRIKAGQSTLFTDSSGQVWLADQGFSGGQTSPGFFNFGGGGSGFGGRPGGFGGGRGGAGRSGASYASVIAIDFQGQRQYVQLTATSLVGVSATDGKVLWQYAAPANAMGINCSTPIYQDGLVRREHLAANDWSSG
jgi:hypothetical protein